MECHAVIFALPHCRSGDWVCCASDSTISAAEILNGGPAKRYSRCGNSHLTTPRCRRRGTNDCVSVTSVQLVQLNPDQPGNQEVDVLIRIQRKEEEVFLWLVGQSCSATSLGPELMAGRAPGCQWVHASHGIPSSKSWWTASTDLNTQWHQQWPQNT